jgi:membrane protein implicated in regulation of membrane protease activity
MLWQEWWVWIVAGFALAVLEILAPGYVLLGFAIGAIATGGLMAFNILGTSFPVSILVMAIISLVAWIVLRRIFGLNISKQKIWDRDINED